MMLLYLKVEVMKSKLILSMLIFVLVSNVSIGQEKPEYEIVKEVDLDGLIATNTTISRDGLKTSAEEIEKIGAGGLSGKPLVDRSTEVIRYLAEKSNKSFPIIGVGGIHSADDAMAKLEAGADLVQLYTGFIYEGPMLIKRINQRIIAAN